MAAGQSYVTATNRADSAYGFDLLTFPVTRTGDVAAALDQVAVSGVDSLYVQPDAITFPKFGEIAAFALKRRLVTIGLAPQFVNAGGLLYCGPDIQELLARTVRPARPFPSGAVN